MRILHVTPTYLPAVRYGGTISAVHGLAKGQAELGHDVAVFTTNVDGRGNSPVPLGLPVDVEGVRVSYFGVGVGRRLYRAPTMGFALRQCASAFDILHLHSVFLWPTLAAGRAAASERIPYVLSPHGMLVADLIRRKNSLLKRGWIELFERRTIHHAAAIHVTASLEADDLQSFGFRLPPVWIVPNGVSLPATSAVARSVSDDVLAAANPGRFVLALGRLNWKKNLLALIDAVASIPDQRCIIAGNDDDDHARLLRRHIASRGVSDRVVVLDRQIDEPDKSYLYQSCSLLALPSLHENFGIVALEAMAFCKPVVVSSGAGVASIVAEADAGIVVQPQADAIADAVSLLMRSPARGEACGLSGSRAVRERFAWRRIAEEMVEHYRTVVN